MEGEMAGTKELIERYYDEIWRKGNVDALDDLLTDDYVDHDPTPGFGADKASAKTLVAAIVGAMKDIDMQILDVIVDGDRAAAHWTDEWTQVGEFMGGIPADGKRIKLRGHDFYKIRDGKIAEIWHCEDFLGVMAQLGLIPGA
jgi:steroid delta-isomerase-like uncharacterized protein